MYGRLFDMPIRKNELPSLEILNDFFICDAENGILYWKERDPKHFKECYIKLKNNKTGYVRSVDSSCKSWNTTYANKEAGNISNGYICVKFLGKSIKAHRIIFKMVHGYDPEFIDHINRNSIDNRIENLRSVSISDNNKNTKKRKDNASGYINVYFHPQCSKNPYYTVFRIDGKCVRKHFPTIEEAAEHARKHRESNEYYSIV